MAGCLLFAVRQTAFMDSGLLSDFYFFTVLLFYFFQYHFILFVVW